MTAQEQTTGVAIEVQLKLYQAMFKMKTADDRLVKGITSGEFQCVFWPPRGQEAIAAAVGVALNADDRLVTTYRGLHDLLGKGVPFVEILGEMTGRQVGAARGKGGTMHIAHPESGVMMSTGIVGGGPPVAVGLAMAAQRTKSGRVVAVCFGDGATSTGSFHEAANMASLWKLPVILVCQNNQYAEFTPVRDTMNIDQVVDRAVAYGMPGVRVDGNDPLAMMAALDVAIDRARRGDGPTFLECVTFRFRGHYHGDKSVYIPADDLAEAIANDPVPAFRVRLEQAGVSTADLDAIEQRVADGIEADVAAVMASPLASLDELTRDVYADSTNCPN